MYYTFKANEASQQEKLIVLHCELRKKLRKDERVCE